MRRTQVLTAFFTYGLEERLCQDSDLSVRTRYRALRNKFLAAFNDTQRESRRLWERRRQLEHTCFETQIKIDDAVTRATEKPRAEDKANTRRKLAGQVARLQERKRENEDRVRTLKGRIASTLDASAVARGMYLTLEYVGNGILGSRPYGTSAMRADRTKLAAGRNEATRWEARDRWSDEMSLPV